MSCLNDNIYVCDIDIAQILKGEIYCKKRIGYIKYWYCIVYIKSAVFMEDFKLNITYFGV